MKTVTIELPDQLVEKIEQFKAGMSAFNRTSIPEEKRLDWTYEDTLLFCIEQAIDTYLYMRKVKNPFPIDNL